jgi:hypothetical protein
MLILSLDGNRKHVKHITEHGGNVEPAVLTYRTESNLPATPRKSKTRITESDLDAAPD